MARARVTIQGKELEIVELPQDVSAESWWAGIQREQSATVTLNNTTYLKKDILEVSEVKTRHGSTNMEGI